MVKEYTQYVHEVFTVIKNYFYLIFIPSILITVFYIVQLEYKELNIVIFFVFIISMLLILPLIYGQYFEILLHGKVASWVAVFNSYWLRFLIAAILVKSPIILCILIFPQIGEIKDTVSFLTELFSIYIIPLVFLNKEIINSIKVGIKCVLGNIRFSAPLILITVILFVLPELSAVFYNINGGGVLIYITYFLSVVVGTILHLSVFLTASLILKNKLIPTGDRS